MYMSVQIFYLVIMCVLLVFIYTNVDIKFSTHGAFLEQL